MHHPMIEFTAYGVPAPQGSKSAFRNQHTGRIQQVESSKKVKPWRQDVKAAAMVEIERISAFGPWVPADGPLVVSMVFSFARPKGHWRTGRHCNLLRPSAPVFPHGRPDLSKLARSTEDALTDVLWVDDARIVGYLHLAKVYCNSGQFDALAFPGAVVRLWGVPAGWANPEIEKFTTVMEGS